MTTSKALIFDSGTLITLSMNSLLYILEELKNLTQNRIKFLITKAVKYETLDRPIKIPRFELEALRVKKLMDNNIIELPSVLKINQLEIKQESQRLMKIANSIVEKKRRPIKIISEGEASCLALSTILSKKNIENIIAIDERTTRILSEKPENLKKLMTKKLHDSVQINLSSLTAFKQFRFMRSTELVYVAHKKNILKVKGPKALEAALYATKFKGSSVSFDEINVLKKL